MTSDPIPESGVDWEDFEEPNLPAVEWNREDSNLYQHAKVELEVSGLLGPDADYGGFVGASVLELIETLARQGHSGTSAGLAVYLFQSLAQFEPLTPLTDNPQEWFPVHDGIVGVEEEPLWQSRRKSSAFSNDGGKTHYDLNEPLQVDGSPLLHVSHPQLPKERADA